jgi:RNA polymerase sigma factor (sigma-70 family)
MNTLEYTSKNITPMQWKSIRFLLTHANTSASMTNQIKTKIFYRYSGWALYQAIQFKKFHKHKTRNIALKDLTMYSQIGLYKAVKKYHGKYPFHPHVNIYIQGELFKGLTDLHPITSVSKKERRYSLKKKIEEVRLKNGTISDFEKQKCVYKRNMDSRFVGKEEEWMFDKLGRNGGYESNLIGYEMYEYQQIWQQIWQKIETLEPMKKRIFHLKYSYDFDKIRTNREIGTLMGCSEEYIRVLLKRNVVKLIQK